MSTCTTFSCYLQSLKKSAELEANLEGEDNINMSAEEIAEKFRHASPDELETLNSDNTSNNFRVIFPVILVVSILVVIAVGFLLHRLISSFVWSNWAMPPESEHDDCPQSGRFRRRDRDGNIRTVSGYVDIPPTYRQVMKSKKSEMLPPTYHEVMTGAINCAYVSDEDPIATLGRYQVNIDDDGVGEKRNTNSLIHSRTQNKSISDVHSVVVHTADIFSPENSSNNEDFSINDATPHSFEHVAVGPRDSVDSSSSGATIITVADVIINYSDDDVTVSETGSQSDEGETICSAV